MCVQAGSFLTALLICCIPKGHGQQTSLKELMELCKKGPMASSELLPLRRDWIGDVKRGKEVMKLRLTHAGAIDGEIRLYRMQRNTVLAREMPLLVKSLPSIDDVNACETVKQLEVFFGKSKAHTSSWGSFDNRMHWTVAWTFFTRKSDQQLRYMSVFGQVSRANDQQQVDVDSIRVAHGYLRPADPNSADELKEYPTGETLYLEEESRKEIARRRYPSPLRELIEADEHPNDPDLKVYTEYLTRIRQHPDPKLLQQLIAEMHDGTLQMQSLLRHILVGGRIFEVTPIKLLPWRAKQREVAINTCVNAMPLADDDNTVSELVEILLGMSETGGTIIVSGRDGTSAAKVTVNATGYIYDTSPKRPSLQETQAELRRMLLGSPR